jgi:hypothetical protein
MNQPWGYDQYSPIDLSLLEPHFGTLETWRRAVKEIHARGEHAKGQGHLLLDLRGRLLTFMIPHRHASCP